MNLQYAVWLSISALVALLIAMIAWTRRPAPGATALVGMALALVEWTFTYALHWLATDISTRWFWLDITYIGVVLLPIAFLVFALEFTHRGGWLTRRRIIALLILPLLTLVILWTDPLHNLFYGGKRGAHAIFDGGPWFWLNVMYEYGLVLLAIGMIVRTIMRSSQLHRRQASAIMVGVSLPLIVNLASLAQLSPFPDLDLTPFAFTLTSLSFVYGLLRFRLLDLLPIARDALIESMDDAVLVVDLQNRIVDLNPAAAELIEQKSVQVIGQPIVEALARWRGIVEQFQDVYQTQTEIVAGEHSKRNLDIRISPLQDRRGRLTGRLVIVRDITDRKRIDEEMHRRIAELITINAISHVAASERNVNAMIEMIGEKLRQILNVQGAYIALYDPQANLIHYPYWRVGSQRVEALPVSLGQGLASVVIQSLQPLVINQDYMQRTAELDIQHRIFNPTFGLPKSWLGVPIHVGDQVIGVVSAANFEQENVFTDEDVRLWSTIADNLAIAIRNVQLYNETSQYAEQMAALNRISLAITEGLDINRVLSTLHEQCRQIAPIDIFYIALYDETHHQLWLPYFNEQGEVRSSKPRDIREHPGLTGYVIQTRRSLYLPDTLDEKTLPIQIIRSGGTPARSYVGVPLIAREQVVGVVSMQSYQPHAYSLQQVHMLELVAVQAAIAIVNAQLHEQVQQLAITDDLTGLFNRRALFQRGQDEVNRAKRFGRPLAAIMLDIDHFKIVNDTYTHAAGDQVLQAIADTCRANLRNTDLAARYGGEEFAVLMPETDNTAALYIAERLRKCIAATQVSLGQGITSQVTVSAGVAVLDWNITLFNDLIQRADQALYLAKQNGRNRTVLWRSPE